MCRANCHKIIKLSGALQEFAEEKEEISNVHGVRTKYLMIGDSAHHKGFKKGAYFVGKLAWPKGLDLLFQKMQFLKKRTGKCFHIDIYGSGPHSTAIKEFASKNKLPTKFHGAIDHSILTEYKVFINPSLSEVLCTTIVEALAMGKWVVCAKHPSNTFFEQFPNCLTYTSDEEFAANVYWALHHDPYPLSKAQRYTLTWEAATERLISASMITKEMKLKSKKLTDRFTAWVLESVNHGHPLLSGDLLRALAGAKSASNQIEYMKQYGTSAPVLPDLSSDVKIDETLTVISEGEVEKGDEGSSASGSMSLKDSRSQEGISQGQDGQPSIVAVDNTNNNISITTIDEEAISTNDSVNVSIVEAITTNTDTDSSKDASKQEL